MTTTQSLREYLDAHGIDGPPTEPGWYVVDDCIYGPGIGYLAVPDGALSIGCALCPIPGIGAASVAVAGSNITRHAPLTLASPAGRDLDAEVIDGVQAARRSIIRENAERDPDYLPYCGRCRGLVRMQKVSPFFWRCSCGAEHDERDTRRPGGKGRHT